MCGGYGGTRCGRQAAAAGTTAVRAIKQNRRALKPRGQHKPVAYQCRTVPAGAGRGAIQVPVVCISPAEQARTMMFMLYFSFRKRKP